MKEKLWSSVAVLFMAAAALFTSCSDDEVTNGEGGEGTGNVTITFKEKTVTVSPNKKTLEMAYTLNGAAEEYKLDAKADGDWISGFDTSAEGVLKFNVAENESSEAREGNVTLTYTSGKDKAEASFKVKQSLARPVGFELEVSKTGSTWGKFSLKALDERMSYMVSVIEKNAMDAYATDDDFFAAEMERVQKFAESLNVTPEEVLEVSTQKGNLDNGVFSLLKPATEYYVVSYGFNGIWELATEVTKTLLATTEVGPADLQLSFEIDAKVFDATATITPTTYDSYAIYIAQKADIDAKTDEELKQILLEQEVQSGILKEQRINGLLPGKEFTIVGMGCAGGVATTAIFREDFSTSAEVQSEIKLTLDHRYCDAVDFDKLIPGIISKPEGKVFLYGLFGFTDKGGIEAAGKTYKMVITDQVPVKDDGTPYTDEEIRVNTIFSGMDSPLVASLPYGSTVYVYGVPMDKSDNYGELMKKTITCNEENSITANEMWNFMQSGIVMPSSADNMSVSPWMQSAKTSGASAFSYKLCPTIEVTKKSLNNVFVD